MSPETLYLVWQKEKCPETNRVHYHVYVRYDKRKKFSTLRRIWPERSHLEIARGTEEECRNYCTKEESRVEPGGERGEYKPEIGSRQGERTDMEEIMDLIREGATMKELAARYPGTCSSLAASTSPNRTRRTGLSLGHGSVPTGPSPASLSRLEGRRA